MDGGDEGLWWCCLLLLLLSSPFSFAIYSDLKDKVRSVRGPSEGDLGGRAAMWGKAGKVC